MLELLFLLLPIAVMYGWYMGVRQANRDNDQIKTSQTQQFVSGIKFLLESQKEKASEIFVDLLHVNADSFDANLALAEVYRVRGDVDKAIRIHNQLIDSDIPVAQRKLVYKELAKDYVQISLYDQAIPILQDLMEDHNYQASAVKLLIKIYQSLTEWDQCIVLIEQYRDVLDDHYVIDLKSQFMCEKAQSLILNHKNDQAEELLLAVIELNPMCIRAVLQLSQLFLNNHKISKAKELLNKIPELSPDMIMEALPLLRSCYELPREQSLYFEELKRWQETNSSSSLVVEIAHFMNYEKYTEAQIYQFILMHLKKNPSLRLFSEMLRHQQNTVTDPTAKENIGMIQSLVNAQIAKNPIYQCNHCGFQSKILFWHCPNCSKWSTFYPIKGFDGD